ncbi:MAG: hypothetical protein RLZZ511_1839 [Cyanobacteriota bacterium]|jgi:hypothetical protein
MERDELKSLIRELLPEALAEVLSPVIGTQVDHGERWVSLKDAVEPLGYPSYNALHKAIQSGVFRLGKELRDRRNPGAKSARLQIHLGKAQKRLSEDPANRRVV